MTWWMWLGIYIGSGFVVGLFAGWKLRAAWRRWKYPPIKFPDGRVLRPSEWMSDPIGMEHEPMKLEPELLKLIAPSYSVEEE